MNCALTQAENTRCRQKMGVGKIWSNEKKIDNLAKLFYKG